MTRDSGVLICTTVCVEDYTIISAKGRENRPALDNLLKEANRRKFDLVAAWSLDRLGRSLKDLLSFLDEIHALGIDLYLHQQGLDTTTLSGRAMFQMCGVFAEFERSIIRERINAGLARARANGKRLGRPKVDRKLRMRFRKPWVAGSILAVRDFKLERNQLLII